MDNEFIQNRPMFDVYKLVPGFAVQYVVPENLMMGEHGRTYDCLVKKISPLEITLSRFDHRGELIDETFSVDRFAGDSHYSYKLKNPFADTVSLTTAMEKILKCDDLETIKTLASESINK